MSSLSGVHKAAVLLRSLPADVMEKILAQAGPEKAGKLRAELGRLTDSKVLAGSLREVIREIDAILNGAAGADAKAGKGVDVVAGDKPTAELPADPIEALKSLPADALTRALETEQPRTVSLVLNLVDAARAGEIYRKLPAALRREASVYFASQPMPGQEILRRIVQAVVAKTVALETTSDGGDGTARVRKMADLLRQVDRAERADLLALLETKDPASAQAVKDQLYQFEDLLRMENASVQKLLGELDTKSLALALKGAAPEIEAKVLANLSKRAQETLKEEIDLLGNVSAAKAQPARKVVVDAIRLLDEKGELSMME
jgi:flagellar motor switch protein FliG